MPQTDSTHAGLTLFYDSPYNDVSVLMMAPVTLVLIVALVSIDFLISTLATGLVIVY